MTQRVLVVDDDRDFAEILQTKLERAGFEVDTASNGEEGLEKIKNNAPNLVILDVMMPKKNGFEVCREVKSDPELAEIPIIMLTAVADHIGETSYTQYDAMNIEAEDYIPKGPDCSDKVVESAQRLLSSE